MFTDRNFEAGIRNIDSMIRCKLIKKDIVLENLQNAHVYLK